MEYFEQLLIIFNKSITTGVTGGTGTTYPFGAPEFTSFSSGIRVAQSLVFCDIFFRSLTSSPFLWPLYCVSIFILNKF